MKRKALRAAFPHTLPVLTGYAFLGLAYGILMQSAGFPFWYPALISLVVYAGSMQYAAVPLLGAAFDPAGAFFLTLMVNARHLFYGVSMLEPYRAAGKKTPYLVFAMSDETFSVNVSACPPEGVDRGWFMFWVSLLDQLIGKIKRQRRQPGILLCRSEDFLRSAAAEMKVVPHCAQKSADIRQHLYAAHGGVAFAPAHGCARVKHKYRTDTFKKQFPHPRPPIFCPVFPYLLKTPHDGKRPSAAEPCTAACGAAFPRQARGWSPQARRLRLPPA